MICLLTLPARQHENHPMSLKQCERVMPKGKNKCVIMGSLKQALGQNPMKVSLADTINASVILCFTLHLVVVVVAFSTLARIWGVGWTIHSPLAGVCLFVCLTGD